MLKQFEFPRCGIYVFLARTYPKQIEGILDKSGLNARPRKWCFEPDSQWLRFCFIDYSGAREIVPSGEDGISLPSYREMSLSCFIRGRDKTTTDDSCGVWHLPLLYLDNRDAVEIGRRDFGFPKQLGTITMPRRPEERTFEVMTPEGEVVIHLEVKGDIHGTRGTHRRTAPLGTGVGRSGFQPEKPLRIGFQPEELLRASPNCVQVSQTSQDQLIFPTLSFFAAEQTLLDIEVDAEVRPHAGGVLDGLKDDLQFAPIAALLRGGIRLSTRARLSAWPHVPLLSL